MTAGELTNGVINTAFLMLYKVREPTLLCCRIYLCGMFEVLSYFASAPPISLLIRDTHSPTLKYLKRL